MTAPSSLAELLSTECTPRTGKDALDAAAVAAIAGERKKESFLDSEFGALFKNLIFFLPYREFFDNFWTFCQN